jgi:Protein of unknown function (DUF642)
MFSITLLTLSALATAQTNMLMNPGFEKAASLCKYANCFFTDSAAIAPWSIVSGTNIEVGGPLGWKAYAGDWSVDLNSNTPYAIGQAVRLIPGAQYVGKFMLAQNTHCGSNPKSGFVGLTGSSVQAFSHNNETMATWVPMAFTFTATTIDSMLLI